MTAYGAWIYNTNAASGRKVKGFEGNDDEFELHKG